MVELAVRRENTPVRLLYVRGQRAERAVSPIFVATVVVRVAREPDIVLRFPERVETFVLVVERFPERDTIFASVVVTRPERVETVPERVAIEVV